MAINEPRAFDGDPTRGAGPNKITEAVEPDLNAPPDAQRNEDPKSGAPDPARGGCMRFGWGCLPLMGFLSLLPIGLLYQLSA